GRRSLWKSAHEARHVALSLVGESLLYPQINELILELHRRKLSTFLVSNSQLPEKLKAMPPCHPVVPLFLSILSTRQERTAIRITVIKKLNCRREDIPGYVKLIRLGRPCFIELKAFSFVGGTRHRHAFFLSSLLPTFPGQTSVLSMQGGLRLPLKVITGAVSVHHERKAVVMVRRDLFVGWELDSVSWIDFDKFFSLYGSPDFDALSYSIPIHDDRLITPDDRLITPDDRLITPDEDSSLKKPPPSVTVKKTTTLFMAML
ncbi:S-adenosyl-L-methionine-dependent tRNA 4-demethylwyosine synthase like protein, partial [Aduncisulcus paluster]